MDKLTLGGDVPIPTSNSIEENDGYYDDNDIEDSASEECKSSYEPTISWSLDCQRQESGIFVSARRGIDECHPKLLDEFIEYTVGHTMSFGQYGIEKITLEGLQEFVRRIPADLVEKTIYDYNVLHHYVGYYNPCPPEGGIRDDDHPPADIQLEVVQYLLELAPDAVYRFQVKSSDFYWCNTAHPRGEGAYPLHIACFNADCPSAVIKFLFEKNPSVVGREWKCRLGLPLHNYLERALIHEEEGYEDDDTGGWIVEEPSFPSGKIDFDVVQMLVDAYPEALTNDTHYVGTPLRILCKGQCVSLKLAQLLTDKDKDCFEIDYNEKRRLKAPIWALIENRGVTPFADDVFRYLIECSHSSLEVESYEVKDDESYDGVSSYYSESPLNAACKNPNMSAESMGLIIKHHPEMAKQEYESDRHLPLHTLCKNKKMEEQRAIAILKLLVGAYPESVKKAVGKSADPLDEYLIEQYEGKSPINIAEEKMSFGFFKALLVERAKVSSIPEANILQIACIYKCKLDTIQKLAEDDRRLLLREDGDGNIALLEAARRSKLDVVQYLVDRIKPLLSDGKQLPSMPGASILHIACVCKCPSQLIKRLVEDDPDLLQSVDGYRRNAVHVATMSGSINIVKFIVDQLSENLTSRDIIGRLPIHIAASSKSLDIVKYLVGKDQAVPYTNVLPLQSLATLKVPEKLSGELPLHSAAAYGSYEVVEYLVDMNESALVVPDNNGDLPLHKACRRGNSKVVEYLMTKCSTSVITKNYSHQFPNTS